MSTSLVMFLALCVRAIACRKLSAGRSLGVAWLTGCVLDHRTRILVRRVYARTRWIAILTGFRRATTS
jgi:hypothetical protein